MSDLGKNEACLGQRAIVPAYLFTTFLTEGNYDAGFKGFLGFSYYHRHGASTSVMSQDKLPSQRTVQTLLRKHLADYDSEIRLANGRVDTDATLKRLKELGVTTYYWLLAHAATDWDDLKIFLPKASQAGIEVWVYLLPPSESPPILGNQYSEPYRLDYPRWAEEIARLSLQHPNLTAWVIDDFGLNPRSSHLPISKGSRQNRRLSIRNWLFCRYCITAMCGPSSLPIIAT